MTYLLEDKPVAPDSRPTEPVDGTVQHAPQPAQDRQGPLADRAGIARRYVGRLLSMVGNPPLTIVLWNGEECSPPDGRSVARIYIHDRLTLAKLLLEPLFQFGEAYRSGRIEVEGNLAEALTAIYRAMSAHQSRRSFRNRMLHRWRRPRPNSPRQARENIHHHYDVRNAFYKLWLDQQMVYTCAYFPQPTLSLEHAQVAKMDHVCRKLRLQPGEFVCEAGCGWGALAIHMARHYGVKVKAFNISREQVTYARDRARREQLGDRVEFIEDDWRNINTARPCDVFVSVGMLEHLGVRNYRELGSVINRCLASHGRGMIHSIGQNFAQPLNSWIERRIFPGAYPPTLREMMAIFEPFEFSVLDVENLRLHYAATLRHWLRRFEQSVVTIRDMFDEQFVRMWRLYLAGSTAAFETGGLQLFQVLFTHGANNDLPWSRAHLYPEALAADMPHGTAHAHPAEAIAEETNGELL